MKLNRGPTLLLALGAAVVLVLAVVMIVRMHNGRSTQEREDTRAPTRHVDKHPFEPDDEHAEEAHVETAIEPEAEEAEAAEEGDSPGEAAEETEPTGYSIAGRVVDENGATIAEAEVEVLAGLLDPSLRRGMREVCTVKTNEAGSFRAANLPRCPLYLRASKEGHLVYRHRGRDSAHLITLHPVDYSPGQDEVTGITLVLPRGLQIVGLVVDQHGGPVPEARVWVHAEGIGIRVYTDEQGKFTAAGLPPGEYWFQPSAKGFVVPNRCKHGLFKQSLSSDEPQVVLEMERGITIQGNVCIAGTGQPAPHARVVARSFLPPRRTETDEEGHFYLDLTARQKTNLYAEWEGYVSSEEVVIDPTQGNVPDCVVIELVESGSIVGTVLDKETREPVEGVELEASLRVGQDPSSVGARTDEAGVFRLDGLRPGRHHIELDEEYKPTEERIGIHVVAGQETTGVEILVTRTVEEEEELAGRVVNARGEPVSAALVKGLVEGRFYGYDMLTAVTDTEGEFSLSIPPDRFSLDGLLVAHPDYIHRYVAIDEAKGGKDGDASIVVVLRQGGAHIEGAVRDAEGAARQGMTVVLHGAESTLPPEYAERGHTIAIKTEVTDERGNFRFKNLPDGTYHVSTVFAEVKCESSEIEIKSGKSVTGVELTLPRLGCIAGKVTTPDGTPISGVRVLARPAGGKSGWGRHNWQSTTSDAVGEYRFENVTHGDERYVYPRPEPHQPYAYAGHWRSRKVECPDEHVDFVLEPVQCGVVELTVLRRGNQTPVPEFEVDLEAQEGGTDRGEKGVFPDGHFELDNVHPGTYLVHIEAPGFVPSTSGPIEVRAGQTTPHTAYLDDSAIIKGVVVRKSDQSPVTFFWLTLEDEKGEKPREYREQEFSSSDGSFECTEGIGPGTYRILIAPDALPPLWTDPFRVAAGAESVHRIEVPDGITLQGRVVTESGSWVADAAVRLEVSVEGEGLEPRRTTTDQRGAFTFPGLPVGEGKIRVTHPEYAELVVEELMVTVDPPMKDLVLTLDEGGRVFGRVTRALGDTASSRIWLHRHDSFGRRETGAHAKGDFEFVHVPAGAYFAVVEGTNAVRGPFEVVTGQEHEVDFDLSSVGSLSGKIHFVSLSDGEMSFRVSLRRRDPITGESQWIPVNAEVDEDSSYTIGQLTPGTYAILVDARREEAGKHHHLRVETVPSRVVVRISENSETTANVTVFEQPSR